MKMQSRPLASNLNWTFNATVLESGPNWALSEAEIFSRELGSNGPSFRSRDSSCRLATLRTLEVNYCDSVGMLRYSLKSKFGFFEYS